MPTKVITLEELRQHASKEELWLLISGKGLSHSTFLLHSERLMSCSV